MSRSVRRGKSSSKNRNSVVKGGGSRIKSLAELALGDSTVPVPAIYSPQVLEAFPNRHPSKIAWTSFVCTEFTSLCPKTGQPDFARIYVNYIADQAMVESKSMKLYLFSFRNHGEFHENCVQTICDDLVKLLSPNYLEVIGEFTPRGGISIYPFASYAHPKKVQFQKLYEDRLSGYAPGKYSMPLEKIY